VLAPGFSTPAGHALEQKPELLDEFFLKLHQQHPQARLGVCIEQSRGPVIYALMKYAFVTIYPVNPRSLADFRRAFTVSGAKSDPRDGDLLCELGAKHHTRLHPLQPEEPCTRQLRLLVEARRNFVDDRTALGLQLVAALKCYYPLFLDLFPDDPTTPMAFEFVRRWPNLQKLKAAKPAVLRAFFYKHNSRSEEKIKQRLEAVTRAAALTADPAIIQPFELKVLCLARQLAAADQSIEQFDSAIEVAFRDHSQAALFRELPGAGKVLAPRLAALFGTQRENWTSAGQFQCWTGVAPVTKQSGAKSVVLFRRARPFFLHQSIVEFAKSSLLYCPWARLLYEHQKAQGKSVFAAIRTVAFKWLRILFRCWKNNVAYDENQYLRGLQKRGIKIYETLYAALPAQPGAELTPS
jgi:transposase